MEPISIAGALARIDDLWSPSTVATVNDYDVRLVRVLGDFVRHSHEESDEFFLVIDGQLTIRMDSGAVTLSAGEMFVVPRGAYHQPVAPTGASVLLFEPRDIVNTGDAGGPLTAPRRRL